MGLKSQLVYFSRLCYSNKFVAATDGNISVRTPNNFILSTPTSLSKGKVKAADLVKTDIKGKVVKGTKKPSTELKLHAYIYQSRKDINAIVHTHPKFASAFAVAVPCALSLEP